MLVTPGSERLKHTNRDLKQRKTKRIISNWYSLYSAYIEGDAVP